MSQPQAEAARTVLERVERAEDPLVATLRRLIRHPTVNPPGNEREHQEFVAGELQALGLACELVEAVPDRPNVVAVLKGAGSGQALLHYAGHADVVAPGDAARWRYPPFAGEVHDGWVWGRGAADHKGPIAASLAAVRAIVESGVRLAGDVVFLVPVDEKCGSRAGTRHLVTTGLLYGDMGIYGSCGSLDEILIACAGTLTFEITVRGEHADRHAGEHGLEPRAGHGRRGVDPRS